MRPILILITGGGNSIPDNALLIAGGSEPILTLDGQPLLIQS